jgi:hypothetical protein
MTTRRIELEGASIACAGRLRRISWREATRRIEAGGGEASDAMRASLTCFVEGVGAGSEATRARARGVLAITEAQLMVLLEHGLVEWEEAEPFADKASFDASVAELRAIFGAAPNAHGWTRCLEIVEGCEAERLDDLLHYLHPFIAGWDKAKMGAWICDDKHPLMQHAPKDIWLESLPHDELRVAPPRWVYELVQGQHHPKHAIARALSLDSFKLNGALAKNVLASPHLRALRYLDLGRANAYPVGLYRALLTSELMRTVRVLCVPSGAVHPGRMVQAWASAAHVFDALEQVRSEADLYTFYEATGRHEKLQYLGIACIKDATFTDMHGKSWR